MILVTIWWVVSARKWFKGPKVNIEHMMLGREEAVVVGQGPSGDNKDRDSSSGEARAPEKLGQSKS